MPDILLLRKDPASAIARLETRQKPQPFLNLSAFQALEAERKRLQARRSPRSRQIRMSLGQGDPGGADTARAQVAAAKLELAQSAARLERIQAELQTMLEAVPNLPHDSVPVGADASGNIELRRWGQPASPAFALKDHVDIG